MLVRNIATYQAELEQYTEVWLYKIGTPDALDRYERASSFLSAAMEKLHALRRTKPTPSLPFDIHRSNGHGPHAR